MQPLFINSVGVIHGGMICSLADITRRNTFPIDEHNRQTVVTVNLKTSFLKSAKGKYLVADAHVVKMGRTLNHIDCFIYNDNHNLVAKSKGLFANT